MYIMHSIQVYRSLLNIHVCNSLLQSTPEKYFPLFRIFQYFSVNFSWQIFSRKRIFKRLCKLEWKLHLNYAWLQEYSNRLWVVKSKWSWCCLPWRHLSEQFAVILFLCDKIFLLQITFINTLINTPLTGIPATVRITSSFNLFLLKFTIELWCENCIFKGVRPINKFHFTIIF